MASESPEVYGKLILELNNQKITANVLISVRGKTSKTDCTDIPKLKVKITSDLNGTPLAGLKKFAINTHCKEKSNSDLSGRVAAGKSPLRESVVYEMQDLLGIPGYKTSLVDMTYILNDNNSVKKFPALFLEPKKQLLERTQSEKMYEEIEDFENEGVSLVDFFDTLLKKSNAQDNLKALMFEALIGNSDYGLGVHDLNGKRSYNPSQGDLMLWNMILFKDFQGKFRLGTTDYDMSNIVLQNEIKLQELDAEMTKCSSAMCYIQFMIIQKWRAFFKPKDFEVVVKYYLSQQDALLKLIEKHQRLNTTEKKYFRSAINSFYDQLAHMYHVPVWIVHPDKVSPSVRLVYHDSSLSKACGQDSNIELSAPVGLPAKVISETENAKKVYLIDTRDGSMTNPDDFISCVNSPVWIPKSEIISPDWPRK